MPSFWPELTTGASGNFTVDITGKLTDIWSMSGIEQLLSVARLYAEIEGVPLSTVSSRAFNDGKRLAALEGGDGMTVKRLEAGLRWFADRVPEDKWPHDVPRPVAGVQA